MRTRLIALLGAVLAAAIITLGADQSRDVTRNPPAAAPAGTGTVTGVLTTDGETPQPVRRATVRLAGAAGSSDRLVGTDDQGRFAFDAVPVGRYSLSAVKAGFVTTFFGAKRPGRGPGVPVAVADGQRIDAALKMLPGAVITGLVIDSYGRPAAGVPVTALEVRTAGATSATPVRATTDDRGIYRIYGLAPGSYVVAALPRLITTTDITALSDADVKWARASGATIGPGVAPPSPARPRAVSYSPVYYPGTVDVAAAAALPVATGEEQTGVDFALRIVPTARLAGTLVDHNGQPLTAATVALFPKRGDRPSPAELLVASGALVLPRAAVTAPAFTIAGVTPGEYTLVARSGSGTRAGGPPPESAPPGLWSITDLTVDGSDRTDLVLRLQPGVVISGSIGFERGGATPPASLQQSEVVLVATRSLVGAPATPRAVVDASGAFRFASVVPGAYALKVTLPPQDAGPWVLKSAMLGGRDLADVVLDVKPAAEIAGIVATFSDRAASITGRLIDAAGRPITRYSIVAITTDRSLWMPGARRIRSATPATDGSFAVTGLPAGEYALAAIEDLDAADLGDPELLAQFLSVAFRMTLAPGEARQQDLRIGGER